MKRTILIPTDFSVKSLNLVNYTLANAGDDKLYFVLTHCRFLSDCPIDLLYYSKTELLQSLKNPEFKKACKALRQSYSADKVLIKTELFTGLNQAAFKTFIDGNQINEAVIPKRYNPRLNRQKSFNPIPFIRRSHLKITEVSLGAKQNAQGNQELILLPNGFLLA
ncbi:hypothetical protein [Methylotuvimicrobium sp. KM1]|uniref:hypothetical protein n=1 Tax=Methylotuvimicrobium sp. KM1 TaxID=3377707 RepID=UPI00384E36A3